MDTGELLAVILEWQHTALSCRGITRALMAKITPVLGSKPIKIITGFRRSGKSFLTQQIIQYFVNNNLIERDNFLYINFEDYRFE